MKPNFALTLSHDGIGLLHRGRDGWHMVGDVMLQDAEFTEKLGFLRQTAASLENAGVTTKLVIPNSQILYTTVDAPGPSEAERHAQIRAALEGATPYDIGDLAYDWCEVDGAVQVAVIARETLDEAEGFAADHGFNPLSFVATPADDSFIGEPFFGVTAAADTLLEGTETVEQDDLVVSVLAPAPQPEPADITEPEPVQAKEVKPEPEVAKPDQKQPDEPSVSVISAKFPEPDEPSPKTAIPAFSTRRGNTSDATPDKTLDRIEQIESRLAILPKPKEGQPTKPLKLGNAQRKAIPKKPVAKPVIASKTLAQKKPAPVVTTDPILLAPKTTQKLVAANWDEEQAMTVFGARRKLAQNDQPKSLRLPLMLGGGAVLAIVAVWAAFFLGDMATLWRGGSTGDAIVSEANPGPEITPVIDTPVMVDTPVVVDAPVVAAPPAVVDTPVPDPAVGQALAMLTEPVFRQAPLPTVPAASATIDTSGIPVAAAAIDAPVISQPTPVIDTPVLVEPEPVPTQIATPTPLPEASPLLSPETALENYADSGIWQLAPVAPGLPRADDIYTLHIASLDPQIVSQDAVALPVAPATSNDYSAKTQTSPAAQSAEFVLDDRGLVVASLAGTLTPDGVFVYLGPPPIKPRARGNRVPQVVIDPNLRLASFRPAARPVNQAIQSEPAQLGGAASNALSGFRPKPRPGIAPIIEEIPDAPATAQAVKLSSLPKHRPANFAKVVARARASAPTVTATTAAPVPQNQTVAPSAPTGASVARMATTKNAINLRRVSLIGVYGSPSDRRALVRLPSGRYVKVKVGQRVDGGKVAAIGEAELRYVKGGRTIVLKMPKT